MVKIIFFLLLIGTGNSLSAQYLHYWDDSKKNNYPQPANTNPQPAKPAEQKVIYHDWPDLCPGLSGAIPVLKSYVPKDIVLILTEKFKGHLYSIISNKGADNKLQYKLKVCADGQIKYEYADEAGNLITK